jgi:hypothetical protein
MTRDDAFFAILRQQRIAIVNECTKALRDGDPLAVRRAIVHFFGVEPPSGDAECRAELFRLVRVSEPTRDELVRARPGRRGGAGP